MHTAINDGPGCLTLRCADPSCGAAIGEDMVLGLVSEEDQQKYMRYLLRSYVEDNRKVNLLLHFISRCHGYCKCATCRQMCLQHGFAMVALYA
jgi:hypothetical protein